MQTSFIIPTIGRKSLWSAVESCGDSPVLIGHDKFRLGEGEIRNRLIKQAKTEWVSFLDDDDTVSPFYVVRLAEEINNHPDADLIIFRQLHWTGSTIPKTHEVRWGNIGNAFSVRRSEAIKHPFQSQYNEDFHFVNRFKGKVVFSDYVVYFTRQRMSSIYQ